MATQEVSKVRISKGRVRYWSVYDQVWVVCPVKSVPARDLATMPESQRQRIEQAAKAK